MSLTDKYKDTVAADKQKQQQEKEEHELYSSLGFYHYGLLRPLTVDENTAEKIKEAVTLIRDDKWKKAKMPFTASDAVYYWSIKDGKEEVCIHLIDEQEWYGGPDSLKLLSSSDNVKYQNYPGISAFVKLLWEDGTIRCGCLSPVTKTYPRGILSAGSKAKAGLSDFLEEANRKRYGLKERLYGSQEYVIWDFRYYFSGDGNYSKKLLLFKDGIIFDIPSYSGGIGNICFEDDSIFCMDKYGAKSFIQKLDDWLIGNVRRLNGE